MKVLLINGSPHQSGCTYTALSEVARTLDDEGIRTEILQLGVRPVQGCIACNRCAGTHRCAFEDGVNAFLERMEHSDGLIVGSPVYFAAPNGSLIAMLNRAFYAGSCFAHKPAAAVVSARRAGTTSALNVLNEYFTISQMPVVSSQYWNMVHGSTPDEVRWDEEGLQIMRTLGHNMAWTLRCIERGRVAGVEPTAAEKRLRTDFIR